MIPPQFSTRPRGVYDDSTSGVFATTILCGDSDLNQSGRIYEMAVRRTVRPIDLSNMMIHIRGKITTDSGIDLPSVLEHRIKLFSSWIYNSFSRATLSIGGVQIESVDNLALTTEMLKAFLPYDALASGTYENQAVFDRPNDGTSGALAAADLNAGLYSLSNRSHLLNADGTYEVYIPASFIFQSLKTLPTIYMRLFPAIRLERTNPLCTGIEWNKYADSTYPGVYNAAATGRLMNKISYLALEYDEYDLPPTIEKMVIAQYLNTTIIINHRKLSHYVLKYKGSSFSSDIPLSPGIQGNVLLIMCPLIGMMAQTERSKNRAGYLPERISLDSIRVMYGRHVVLNQNDMSLINIGAGAARHQDYGIPEIQYTTQSMCLRTLYNNYLNATSYMYSDPTLAMPFNVWRERLPLICIDLTKYIFNSEEITRQISVNFIHKDTIASDADRQMAIWLISANTIKYDPSSHSVEATGV